jgi:hypothetical protein
VTARPFPKSSPGVFVWGHVFQRGDLPLYVYDGAGNPFSPSKVTFTMYHTPKGQSCPRQCGPANRTPVTAGVGEYYVSGVAGELGQTGDWTVKWVYEEAPGWPAVEVPFHFKVYDSSQFAASCRCRSAGCKGGCR